MVADTIPKRVTINNYDYQRTNPIYPRAGTINWKPLQEKDALSRFSPRFGHATCIFRCPDDSGDDCIWLTGGHSDKYQTFDMKVSERNSDVWWSKDSSSWNKVMNIDGDYVLGLGNWDAKVPGPVAPWYSRHGHSLEALDADGDGVMDAMILAGGNSPVPSNDTWITTDGIHWYFDGKAPWNGRSYHASAVFKGENVIIGGTPLNNEVWSGKLVVGNQFRTGFTVQWRKITEEVNIPFSPRAGACITTKFVPWGPTYSPVESKYYEDLYLFGGFAGFPMNDDRYDNFRCRNDVWKTNDGGNWTRIMPPKGANTMPWVGRAWHGCTTWHDRNDKTKGINLAATNTGDAMSIQSRLYIVGGAYLGTKRNHVVRTMEGYLDVWWSANGSVWNKVNYDTGPRKTLYSSSEWSKLNTDGEQEHWQGKWAHTLESFFTRGDINGDGKISSDAVYVKYFTQSTDVSSSRGKVLNVTREDKIPSLLLIGGKFVKDGPLSNAVHQSQPGGKRCTSKLICTTRFLLCSSL